MDHRKRIRRILSNAPPGCLFARENSAKIALKMLPTGAIALIKEVSVFCVVDVVELPKNIAKMPLLFHSSMVDGR